MKLTITEFSKRKGISKQAVYKAISVGKYAEYISQENGTTYIDERALDTENIPNAPAPQQNTEQDKASTGAQQEQETIQERYIRRLETQIDALQEELKEQRAAQAAQQQQILSLLDKQIQIQENFQVLLAQRQLPQTTQTDTENDSQPQVENVVEQVENVVDLVEQEVDSAEPKKARKWRLFKRRGE